jgi:hypothetical protein
MKGLISLPPLQQRIGWKLRPNDTAANVVPPAGCRPSFLPCLACSAFKVYFHLRSYYCKHVLPRRLPPKARPPPPLHRFSLRIPSRLQRTVLRISQASWDKFLHVCLLHINSPSTPRISRGSIDVTRHVVCRFYRLFAQYPT